MDLNDVMVLSSSFAYAGVYSCSFGASTFVNLPLRTFK